MGYPRPMCLTPGCQKPAAQDPMYGPYHRMCADHEPAEKVTIEVAGTPAPKGSARAFMTRGPNPRAVLASGSSAVGRQKIKAWEQAVREAANLLVLGRSGPVFVDVPLRVTMTFRMARPSGHWRKAGGLKPSAPTYPAGRPDLDKLVRATADALTGSIYDDDARIVAKISAKVYAHPGTEGATITVEAM